MMPADRPMAEFQAGSKLMGGKPRHSPATSRRPARPRLSACDWRGSAGIEKAPRSDQTVEGSSPATVKVTGLTPA